MKNGCSEVPKPRDPPFLWPPQWKSPNPFAEAGSSVRCRRPVVGRCPLRPLTITLPSCASPPHSGTASFAFFRSVILPKWLLCRNCPYQEFSSKFDIFSIDTSKENNPRNIFLETCLFTSTTKGTMPKLWLKNKCYIRCCDQISIREPRQKTCEWKCLNRGWAITSDGSIPCSGQLE